MRYDCKNLQQLKDAVAECTNQDRIVIRAANKDYQVRCRVWDDRIEIDIISIAE